MVGLEQGLKHVPCGLCDFRIVGVGHQKFSFQAGVQGLGHLGAWVARLETSSKRGVWGLRVWVG